MQLGALKLLAAVAGFVVWSSAFVVLYSIQGYACASELRNAVWLGFNAATLVLTGAWLLHLAAGGALLWAAWRALPAGQSGEQDARTFLLGLTWMFAVSGFVATIYIGAPVLVLHPCA